MKYYYPALLFLLFSCNNANNSKKTAGIIPETRQDVKSRPVASYLVPMGDPKLGRKFGVEVYETPHTFKYLLAMQYDALEEKDTLNIPNFDTWPVVEVRPGKDKLSCIIGFLDDRKQFREYKLLSAGDDQLKLTVLRRYDVAR